MQQFVAELIRR